ncbi:MAG: serine protease [Chitinophagia bacterium]|nr:serine protease [Chitinophagia bacterium]NCA29792.1 serine protease [Chitinophagia bacterium]NDD17039.1 serine protease [Chitinophagia bacterium]
MEYKLEKNKKMEDKELIETIERYLTDEMSSQEKTQFEILRKNTPTIDQLVVEHKLFLDHMQAYAHRRSFAKLTSQTFNKLLAAGEWITDDSISTKTKVIQLWNKYKRVAAIAASVGGFIALTTTILVMSLSPSLNGNQLLQLSNDIEVIKKNQQVQGHLINEVKSKVPENAKLISGGSGFLIDTKGFIVTNTHVLKGNGAIVINSEGQELHANIIYSDLNSDLALLKIDDEDFTAPKNIPFIIRKKITDLGEEIFTLGYPRSDNDIVYGKGYLSAQTGYNGDSNSYQIQISANPGSSGAPLFNDKGEIIGIINTRQKQAEGVAFAVKSNKIFDLIEIVNEKENKKADKITLSKKNTANLNNRKSQLSNLKNYIYSIRSYN